MLRSEETTQPPILSASLLTSSMVRETSSTTRAMSAVRTMIRRWETSAACSSVESPEVGAAYESVEVTAMAAWVSTSLTTSLSTTTVSPGTSTSLITSLVTTLSTGTSLITSFAERAIIAC